MIMCWHTHRLVLKLGRFSRLPHKVGRLAFEFKIFVTFDYFSRPRGAYNFLTKMCPHSGETVAVSQCVFLSFFLAYAADFTSSGVRSCK